MDAFEIELCLGKKTRRLTLKSTSVTLGRAGKNTLVVPFEWVSDRHLIVQACQPFARVKLLDPTRLVFAGDLHLTDQWLAIEPGTMLRVVGPENKSLTLKISAAKPVLNPQVAREPPPRERSGDEFGMVMATDAPLEKETGWTQPDAQSSASPVIAANTEAPVEMPARRRSAAWILSWVAAGSGALVLMAIALNVVRASMRHSAAVRAYESVSTEMAQARQLIKAGDYRAAKDELAKARLVAVQWPGMADEAKEIDSLSGTDAIRLGGTGMEPVDGKWYPADRARTLQQILNADRPKLEAMSVKAQSAMDSRKWNEVRSCCEQALALIEAEPDEIKPAPTKAFFERSSREAQSQLDPPEMASVRNASAESSTSSVPRASSPTVPSPSGTTPATAVRVAVSPAVSVQAPAVAHSSSPNGGVKSMSDLEMQVYRYAQGVERLELPDKCVPTFIPPGSKRLVIKPYGKGYVVRAPFEWKDATGRVEHQQFICMVWRAGLGWTGQHVRFIDDN